MDNVSSEKKDVKGCPRDSGYDSLSNKLSILDKLLHTHPVWLQLGLNDTEATEILRAQPPGVGRSLHFTDIAACCKNKTNMHRQVSAHSHTA